jgi:hypothetical protein
MLPLMPDGKWFATEQYNGLNAVVSFPCQQAKLCRESRRLKVFLSFEWNVMKYASATFSLTASTLFL